MHEPIPPDGHRRSKALSCPAALPVESSVSVNGAVARRRIFLVDRHVLSRNAGAAWINDAADLEVCGAAGGMTQAFRRIQQSRPDLVVCEILRPHDLGFIRQLHRRHPRLPILVFSMQDVAVYGPLALAAGARAYLMKGAGAEEFLRRIRALLGPPNAPTQESAPSGPVRSAATEPHCAL